MNNINNPSDSRIQQLTPYYRSHAHDVDTPVAADQLKRLTQAAFTLLTLHKPLARVMAPICDTSRTISCLTHVITSENVSTCCLHLLRSMAALSGLVGSYVAPGLGLLVSTGFDLTHSSARLIGNLYQGHGQQAVEDCTQIINSSLYLSVLLSGSIHYLVAFSALQVLSQSGQAINHAYQGNTLEAAVSAIVATVRYNELQSQFPLLETSTEIETATPRVIKKQNIQALGQTGIEETLPLPKEGDDPVIYHSDSAGLLKRTQLASIKNAKESILVMTFNLSDPDIIAALNERVEAGVKVTAMIDRHALNPIQTLGSPKIQVLTRAVGEGHYHHKILVIDKALSWLGSANFSPDALLNQPNLMTIAYSKELAEYLHQEADAVAGLRNRQAVLPAPIRVGNQVIELLLFPHVAARSSVEETLNTLGKQRILDLIAQAKKSLRLSICVWSHPELSDAVIAAKKRGVDVEVMIWDTTTSDITVRNFKAAGIPVTGLRHLNLVHNKMAIIDEDTLVNGSANWSRSWFTRNDESWEIVHQLTAMQRKYLSQYWNDLYAKRIQL